LLIAVSCIGYLPKNVELQSGMQVIVLNADVHQLREVVVMPHDNGREIEKALENISRNYPTWSER
jgi:hypothetical protein